MPVEFTNSIYVKKDGEWVQAPAIKGGKGDTGDSGTIDTTTQTPLKGLLKGNGTNVQVVSPNSWEVGDNSVAIGDGQIAGQRYYNVMAWSYTNCAITLDSVEGLSVGDVVKYWSSGMTYSGAITAIDTATKTLTTSTRPPVDSTSVINSWGNGRLHVPAKPYLGSQSLHAGDNSKLIGRDNIDYGKDNVVLGHNTRVAGAGNVIISTAPDPAPYPAERNNTFAVLVKPGGAPGSGMPAIEGKYNPDTYRAEAVVEDLKVGSYVDSNLTPDAMDVRDLGSADKRWRMAHIDRGIFGGTLEQGGSPVWTRSGLPVETGTWTPVLGALTSNPACTYTARSGYYTRIGGLVMIGFYVQAAISAAGTGNAVINGLPHPSVTGGGGVRPMSGLTTTISISGISGSSPTLQIDAGVTRIAVRDTAGGTSLQWQTASNMYIGGTGFYWIA